MFIRIFMVGFFENIQSERAICMRSEDSLQIRAFLGYDVMSRTPDHSTLSRFRTRIPVEVYYAFFDLILGALKGSKLLKGRSLGIDSSVIEANASLKGLTHRMTREQYDVYVTRLAEEAGVDTSDPVNVRRFDKQREDRKTSNEEWENPQDPDAKVGRTKRRDTRMIYKPEHVVDLDTGAIVHIDGRPGDAGDARGLFDRIGEAEGRLLEVFGLPEDTACVGTITADKGYYRKEEIAHLDHVGIFPVIPAPRHAKPGTGAALHARWYTESETGKLLQQKRSEKVERSFAHVLESGRFRRVYLRGRLNILKRYLIGVLCTNLSLLTGEILRLRKLFGFGTPKQAAALFCAVWLLLQSIFRLQDADDARFDLFTLRFT